VSRATPASGPAIAFAIQGSAAAQTMTISQYI
jgi:hypothetical protein